MKFQPKTESEIVALRIKPAGEYPFDIATAVDTVSKSSGNEMLAVVLNCYDAEGRVFSINDYLVPGTSYGDKKIFEFAAAIGLSAKYASGEFSAEDCLGRGGFVKIKIGKAQPKDKGNPNGDTFPPKNEVAYYLTKSTSSESPIPTTSPASPPPPPGGINDEDVPF